MPTPPQPHRAVTRWTVFAIMHLVLGAVLTVLVAYARCVVGEFRPMNDFVGVTLSAVTDGPILDEPGSVWHGYQWTWRTQSSLGMVQCTSFMFDPTWEERAFVHRLAGRIDTPPLRKVPPPYWAACKNSRAASPGRPWSDFGPPHEEAAFGWPFLCIHQHTLLQPLDSGQVQRSNLRGVRVEIPFFQSRFNHSGLWPTHILWRGMIGNVLVWAVISTLPRFAWRGVKAGRRAWRTKNGRCPRCGYDRASLAASLPCPECGAA